MKTRQEIKEAAKEAMKQQQGTCILIWLLVALAGGLGGALSFIPFISIAVGLCMVVVSVGVVGAYILIYRRQQVEVTYPFLSLQNNFARKLGGSYWMMLWVWLWSLLLIIPGIIKTLAYSMTPYILSDCPNVTATDALKVSMKLTNGHKGELFVMYLSFIGWMLLSGMTFGILYIVYVGPYLSATMAGYYDELRERALASGAITAAELA